MGELARVGVRDLRQNLSVYLRRVVDGEMFEVTDRGRPVALLRPLGAEDDPIARLEAEGRIIRRSAGDLLDVKPLPLRKGERPLSEILEELREDTV
jgi:prevent-host-death family protein